MRRRRIAALLAGALGAAIFALPGTALALSPLSTFGSAGTAAGQMTSPAGMAIGPDGSAYVADAGNNRIDIFGPSGSFARSLGGEAVPSSAGECSDSSRNGCKDDGRGAAGVLTAPRGVAVDSAGNVYVADTGNNRIDVFSASGGFVHAFGKGVNPAGGDDCTEATGCKKGSGGTAPGALASPRGIGIDAGGMLYVTAASRIDVFTAAGAYSRSFGREPASTGGDRNCNDSSDQCKTQEYERAGAINSPGGVTLSAAGQALVADTGNRRIDVFAADGSFVRAFGRGVNPAGGDVCTEATGCKKGAGGVEAGGLASPSAVAVGAAGNVFVADMGNNRIDEFAPDGSFAQAFGEGVIDGSAGFEVCGPGTGCRAGLVSTTPGSIAGPSGVAVDCRGAVYASEWSSGSDQHNQTNGGGSQIARVERFGESGTAPPPCPAPPGSGPSTSGPSGSPAASRPGSGGGGGRSSKPTIEVELNKVAGTAVLIVHVPDPGALLLKGKGVHRERRPAKQAGEVEVPVVPVGALRRKLKATGKAAVKVKLSYRAAGGPSSSQSLKISLRLLNLL